MAEPFLSEIRIMSFGFPPKGWALCDGQLLPINQNQALFSLLGTTYGGDGRVNFGLPDLQGRVPIHTGGQGGHVLGERGGEQGHTLSISELPQHTHTLNATSIAATTNLPDTTLLTAQSTAAQLYAAAANLQAMAPNAISNVGGSQAHLNMQPFLVLNFSIALQGIFPSQT
jgi:microcystin-dependent protein